MTSIDKNRESVFLRTFGVSPNTRIIDLFLDNPFFEFSRSELIKELKMAKVTLYKTLPIIEESGIIVPTRKKGRTQLYRLNGDSETAQKIQKIIQNLSYNIAEREI